MGMFDSIYFKRPMPEGCPPEVTSETEFQTKSLDCEMLTFEIHEDGKLRLIGDMRLEMCDPGPYEKRFQEQQQEYLGYDGCIQAYASFERDGKKWSYDLALHYWNGELKRIKAREPVCWTDVYARWAAEREATPTEGDAG